MADTTNHTPILAKTPSAAEPQADYAIQVDAAPAKPTTTTTTTTTSTAQRKQRVARVFRVDEKGQKFDKHGIRIGAWEMAPHGDHCVPNILMAWCFPCISVAQISHRMGGSYIGMLLWHGISYCLTVFAMTMAVPTTSTTYTYESVAGRTSIRYGSVDEPGPGPVLWCIVVVFCAIVSLLITLNLRQNVRAQYQIPGNCCGDCICAWCFPCCALAEMATHIKSYKPGSCDFGPSADALPAYDADDDEEEEKTTHEPQAIPK